MSDRVELPTAERAERCGTCRFWWYWSDGKGGGPQDPLENTSEPWGNCRRYHPVASEYRSMKNHDSFNLPIMAPGDWCGEYQPAK
jgi:hypothetical protein